MAQHGRESSAADEGDEGRPSAPETTGGDPASRPRARSRRGPDETREAPRADGLGPTTQDDERSRPPDDEPPPVHGADERAGERRDKARPRRDERDDDAETAAGDEDARRGGPPRRRSLLVAAAVVLLVGLTALVTWWIVGRSERAPVELALHGNVDLRQVDLAFEESERIAEVLVEEGDRVRKDEALARLDTGRLAPQADRADAEVEAARQTLARLRAGNRPEEIGQARANVEAMREALAKLRAGTRPEEVEQARANVESAKADEAAARLRHERLAAAFAETQGRSVSRQSVDDAKAALDVAGARLDVAQRALELAVLGPRKEEIAEAQARVGAAEQALALAEAGARKEDIAEAQARVRAAESDAALLRRRLSDAQLVAPADGVVRTRVMEPGEMASPQRPVLSLAIVDPKWVRAYVSEPDLPRVRPGLGASVTVDGFPDHRFEGRIGFVSPVAEFTPKSVQTEELRTSLVYEVRVFVTDPDDALRLGMPATVHVPLDQPAPQSSRTAPPREKR